MKQTAVEWYAKQMQSKEQFTQEEFDTITNQAKEMEKQQQGYSEEDMKDYALRCVETYLFNVDAISSNLRIPIMENNNKQFEQFKNK
jgi:hypothetical protein